MGSAAEAGSPTTPMDRLPLALKMNPGLDGLYAQTLERSEHLPHFLDIISTIALLIEPLPTSGIAELLGISTYEVVNVLVNLQAIIQIPGKDDVPVTLFHTSLRDFLTTQSRSGRLFAHPRHHVRLFLCLRKCELKLRRQKARVRILPSECTSATAYSLRHSMEHLVRGERLFQARETDSALRLCRGALELDPGNPQLIHLLAGVFHSRARCTGSLVDLGESISQYRKGLKLGPSHSSRPLSLSNLSTALQERYRRTGAMSDLEEAISLNREVLKLQPSPHPNRPLSLNNLGCALVDQYLRTGTMADLEEAISLYREALKLRPSSDAGRWSSLDGFGKALLNRYQRTKVVSDLEESICLCREALELRPPPHPGRFVSLHHLGDTLLARYRRMRTMGDLEEAISQYREGLDILPSSHQRRPSLLRSLAKSLHDMYKVTRTPSHLQEAISHYEELLASHFPVGHVYRLDTLHRLASLLQMRFDATGQKQDLAYIASLREETSQLQSSTATGQYHSSGRKSASARRDHNAKSGNRTDPHSRRMSGSQTLR